MGNIWVDWKRKEIRKIKPKREEHLFSKWIISQGDPTVEINHFEGKGPEWLVHKGTFCFWQRAGLWEEERESTYWCMSAALTLYLFLSFSSNIPLSYLFFLNTCFLFPGFQTPMPWCWCLLPCTQQGSLFIVSVMTEFYYLVLNHLCLV